MKILVTGITSQVGWELMRSMQPLGEVIGVNSQQMNLADPDAIRRVIRAIQPGLIVNPAAYTAVDKAESEPELAMQINGIAPGIIAEEAKRLEVTLIHYSTDYVFDGTKEGPYTEKDKANPQSIYGKSKLAGEKAIQAAACDHLILRTSWVYAARGKNFLKTILRLAQERESLRIVADQFGAPTSARLIADTTAHIIRQIATEQRHKSLGSRSYPGVLNLTSGGATSWHGFASYILEQAVLNLPQFKPLSNKIDAINTSEYPLPAPRPANSLLDSHQLNTSFGISLPKWETGAKLCIAELA